jgi:hypothetical protein
MLLSDMARATRTRTFRKEELSRSSTIDAPLPVPSIPLPLAIPEHGLRMAIIPDAQVREGIPTDHLGAAGRYCAEKRPDVIICGGDWWDMPSLSTHNKPGSIEHENARYMSDIDAGLRAMESFVTPIAKAAGYAPSMIFVEGNHEYRIDRAVNADPKLEGVLSRDDLRLPSFGWTVIPFLQPVIVGGVAFNHYFPSGVMGRPITTARALLSKMHASCFAFHQQGRDIAYSRRADGGILTAIISGSFYQHDEAYMSPLANKHWRGMWMLHEVKDGQFDEMPVSINFLQRRFRA